MNRKIIPDVVSKNDISSLTTSATARDAAEKMTQKNISAVVITDDRGQLIGIVTERDLTRQVTAKGADSNTVTLKHIMTADPDTLSPDDSAVDALELMHSRNYRHLPVTEDGKCVAMVSIRDLYRTMKDALEEDIKETEAFVFGDRYGA